MIQIKFRRIGIVVIAITVNDNHDILTALGLTEQHAMRRLLR